MASAAPRSACSPGHRVHARRRHHQRVRIPQAQGHRRLPREAAGPAIVLGALLDGVPESAVLGLTLLQTGQIGVAMLVAVFVSNLPEPIAASASLLNSGWSLARVYALWSAIAVASALAAGIGYAVLDGASPRTLAFILAFAGARSSRCSPPR